MKIRTARTGLVALAVTCAQLVSSSASAEAPPGPVDQSLLVPALHPDLAPWTCAFRRTGPVCTGELDAVKDWQPFDFSCDVPVYARSTFQRRATRYYDWDYRNYDRYVHQNDLDELSTSPAGPATALISVRTRFREPFAVPGDLSSMTVITEGVPMDIRSVRGAPVLRLVGTLVEPAGQVGTFTGHVTERGVTTRHENVPLDEVLSDEVFIGAVCEAVQGRP
ncbi:hypothetical protein [Oryzobacter terrae]|uniref:hypothetical protein n=1 Tax=Oryzobacter terrae TaxID=1620385 RepID=UPI003671D553